MADQVPGAETPAQETPGVGGPGGTAAEEVDWQARALAAEDRYGNLQPEYTRATQTAREYEEQLGLYELMVTAEDADTRRQAAEALGFEFDEEQQQAATGADDPYQSLAERLERIEQAQTQRQDAESEREYAQAVRGVIDQRLDELMPLPEGRDKAAHETAQNMVFAYALNALPVGDDGLPDLQGALDAFGGLLNTQREEWAQTKRAPALNLNGQTGTQVPNLDNDQERQAYMAARLQAGSQT